MQIPGARGKRRESTMALGGAMCGDSPSPQPSPIGMGEGGRGIAKSMLVQSDKHGTQGAISN
jgi:hypothetical protein